MNFNKTFRLFLPVLVSVLFTLSLISNTTYFTFTSGTGSSATIGLPLDANPNVEGVPLAPGDEIGVFTPDGLCVGGVVWNGESSLGITVWGNNMMTDEIDGIQPGERIYYRIWRHQTDTEIKVVDVEYLQGDGFYQPQGIYRIESLTGHLPPEDPDGVYPEDNASGVSLQIQLRWEEVPAADYYALQLGTDQNFVNPNVDVSTIIDPAFTVTGLQHNTEYFWRVRSIGYGGEGEWSPVYSFRTIEQLDTLRIPLEANWNLISSNISPSVSDLHSIFGSIQNNSIFIKNQAGNVYWPETEIFEIEEWDISESYWIYIDAPDTVEFTGVRINREDVEFDLQRGWQYPANLYQEPKPIHMMLAPILDDVEIVKTHNGLLYWPEFNVNSIGKIYPGQGFQLYLNGDVRFTYPEINDRLENRHFQSNAIITQYTQAEQKFEPKYTNTGESAVLLVEASFARTGDEVAVWDSLGKLVGSGIIQNRRAAVTVWGNNARTEDVKDGAFHNEPLAISLWSADENIEYSVSVSRIKDVIADTVKTGNLRYSADGIYVVRTEKEERLTELPSNYNLHQNYPNPFNPSTTIQYTIPEDAFVRLTVYNVLGQEVEKLVSENKRAGQHQISFDASNLPSGTYLYRLEAGFYVETRRMMLVR